MYSAVEARRQAMKKIILIFFIPLCFYIKNAYAATLINSVGADECLCSIGMSAVTDTTRKITLKQAKALIMAALTPKERRAPGVTIDIPVNNSNDILSYVSSSHPRFLIFQVLWAATKGSDLIGWYSVDIYTGDVFSGVAICAEYYSKKLAALQKKIRRSLYLTDAQYRELKTNGPECVGAASDLK
jgi:hypothetical protein